MNDILNKKVEYFWEYSYPFSKILKNIFKDNFKRKYSLSGDGIFNLIYTNNKVYELTFKEGKTFPKNDEKEIKDINKKYIIDNIISLFQNNNINYSISNGKIITFKLNDKIVKIEIIKKLKEPI